MERFETIISTAVPLEMENVDTDRIIPARYLKAIRKNGYGKLLFRDMRFDSNNEPVKDFILNDPEINGEILVAGRNFGCGSSREHAAWALKDYGFRVVISSYFADIFMNNALNNGLLPVQVTEGYLNDIYITVNEDSKAEFEIDLMQQTVTNLKNGSSQEFEINSFKKECLLKGYDDIDYLLHIKDKILYYEKRKIT